MNQWKFKFQVNKWNHLPLVFRCVVYHGWRACVCVQTTECSTVATVYRLRNRKIAQKKPWVLAQDEGHTIENKTGHTYRNASKAQKKIILTLQSASNSIILKTKILKTVWNAGSNFFSKCKPTVQCRGTPAMCGYDGGGR